METEPIQNMPAIVDDAPSAKRQIACIGDRVVLRQIVKDEYTVGGLVIPKTVAKPTWEAEVVAAAEGRALKVGDRVLIPPGAPEIEIDGDRYLVVKEDAVLCILRETT